MGVEAEVIPVRAGTSVPVLPSDDETGPGTLRVLREMAPGRGWREEPTGAGLPRFHLPGGGLLSWEPGGQLEYSSPPVPSLDALDRGVQGLLLPLADGMAARGIHLLARGVDPRTPLEAARMVLEGTRYPRQREHYDRKGPAGRTMMLQSAALHLNLDLGSEPVEVWNAANTLAPHLVALFANSPARCGAAEPHRSQRAALWRVLDPSRNRVFGATHDPAPDYLAFALEAESFLLGAPGEAPRPFADWLAEGASEEDFRAHLTTLFPEVRPRGYLELRSVDALPARWCVVPAALAWAALHDAPTRRRILDELPPADPSRMERAGRLGVGDPGLAGEVRWLAERALEGLERMAPEVAGPGVIRRVRDFLETFLLRGRDPGDDPGERVEA